jgi:hypothetical protein
MRQSPPHIVVSKVINQLTSRENVIQRTALPAYGQSVLVDPSAEVNAS